MKCQICKKEPPFRELEKVHVKIGTMLNYKRKVCFDCAIEISKSITFETLKPKGE